MALIALALLAVPLPVQEPAPGSVDAAVQAARTHLRASGAALLEEARSFWALPCVSGDGPALRRNARWIQEAFARRGVVLEVLEREGRAPLVTGALPGPPGAPVWGVYAHYDGQPVDPAAWQTPPFEPVLLDGPREAGGRPRPWPAPGEALDPEWRVQGRAVADDKAAILAWLGALDALAAAALERRAGLVFLFEGEEESGSPNLETWLKEERARFAPVGLWLICDGPVHPSRRPQLVFGVRGVLGMEWTVYGADRPLHSGHYGNWAPNPAAELASLIAALHGPDGRLAVPGFYEDVRPLSPAERAVLAGLPAADEALAREYGLTRRAGPWPLAEAVLQPALNLRGLAAGGVGLQARNAIPDRARASFDLRLVPEMEPGRVAHRLRSWLESRGWTVLDGEPTAEERRHHERILRLEIGAGYPAFRTALDDPAVAPVVAAARAWAGERLLLVPSLGGSLPLEVFHRVLGQPLLIVPIANHDDLQHAPHENLRLGNLQAGIELFSALLGGGGGKGGSRGG